jgi:ERCC4-type nuclease
LFNASREELEQVEGIGEARAAMLRRYFDRWRAAAAAWDPDPS